MKKFISILLILAMLLSLCACGKSKAVRNVEEAINSIGEVSTKSKDVILTAKKAYNNLSDEDKAQVENYALLDAAVNNLFEKLKEAMIADQFYFSFPWETFSSEYESEYRIARSGILEFYEDGTFSEKKLKQRRSYKDGEIYYSGNEVMDEIRNYDRVESCSGTYELCENEDGIIVLFNLTEKDGSACEETKEYTVHLENGYISSVGIYESKNKLYLLPNFS